MSKDNYGSSRRRTSNTDAARRNTAGTRRPVSHSPSVRGTGTARRRKKRRSDLDTTQLLMYGIGAVIVILLIVLGVKGCQKFGGKADESTAVSEESSTGESGERLTVNGIDITGMSESQAKVEILKHFDWNMKVTYEDKEAPVNNLMENRVDEILEEAFASDNLTAYEVHTDNMLEAARAEAALIAGNWSMVAKNGGIAGYDKDSGKFTFTEGTNGVVVDQDKLAQDIVDAIQKKDYKAVIAAQTKEVSPDMTAAQLQEKYKTIGTYTTKTTSNSNRNENIRLSSNALNGTIVNPGQEFSFNNTTGARTEAKGYKPATAYLNGEIVQEPGGGVCQLSSTLYNAVIFAGLKSTERHAHSYEPSYVTPGEDAAVSFGGPDFKFVNNSDYPIAIKTSFANQELTVSIYGIPVVKEGGKVRMSSEKTSNLDPPVPVYEEDQTLQPNEEKVVKQAVPGSRWTTYLVVYQDGKEVSRELFHNSSYRGKAAIIKRNTSGVVVTTESPTQESMETVPESMPETAASQPAGPAGPGQEVVKPTQPDVVSPGGGSVTETVPPVSPEGQGPTSAPQENPAVVEPGPQGPGVTQ